MDFLEKQLITLIDEVTSELLTTKESSGFIDRLKTKIFDNVQVKLMNIHIRFEEESQDPYSFGILLNRIEL